MDIVRTILRLVLGRVLRGVASVCVRVMCVHPMLLLLLFGRFVL